MRKAILLGFVVIMIGAFSVFLLEDVSSADPANYSYTYDGYTVTQTEINPNGNYHDVTYSLTDGTQTTTYTVKYLLSNGTATVGNNTNAPFIQGSGVIIVPPKVVNNSDEYKFKYLGGNIIGASSATNANTTITKLYLLSPGEELSVLNPAPIKFMNGLTDLIIDANFNCTQQQVIAGCNSLSKVYISNCSSSATTQFYNSQGRTQSFDIEFQIGTTSSSAITTLIGGNGAFGKVALKLLPGSVAAKSLDLTNIDVVYLDASYWPNPTAISNLASTVTNGSSTEVQYYGSAPVPTTYDVSIAQGQSGVAVDVSSAAENDTVTITLTPGQGKQAGSVTVLKADNTEVQTTVNGQDPNVYSFSMPASNVTVSAVFEDIPSVAIVPLNATVSQNGNTTVTISGVGLKNVKAMYFTVSYDTSRFDISSPAFLGTAGTADLTVIAAGEYAVAFASEQALVSGDLFSFQLTAKNGASTGASAISCTVDINGAVIDNVQSSAATYSANSSITIGALLGDVNGDGVVNEDDAAYLLLYTFRPATHPIAEGQGSVDYNNDGKVDSDDAILLKNHLTSPDQYPLGGA